MAGRHRYLVALALAAALAGLWQADRHVLRAKQSTTPREMLWVPEQVGAWRGEEIAVRPEDAALLPRTEIAMRRYQIPGEPQALAVDLAAVSARDLSAFHNPDSCYRAAGWTIVDKQPLKIDTEDPDAPILMERLLVEKDGVRVHVGYWYMTAGGLAGGPERTHTSRLGVLLDALRWGGTRPATFFRVTTYATGGEIEAELRSAHFIRALLQSFRGNERGKNTEERRHTG